MLLGVLMGKAISRESGVFTSDPWQPELIGQSANTPVSAGVLHIHFYGSFSVSPFVSCLISRHFFLVDLKMQLVSQDALYIWEKTGHGAWPDPWVLILASVVNKPILPKLGPFAEIVQVLSGGTERLLWAAFSDVTPCWHGQLLDR